MHVPHGRGKHWGARAGKPLGHGLGQTELGDESCNQVRNAHAQRKNHQTVLGIISRLKSVIPSVKHLNEGARETRRQDKRDSDEGSPRSHRPNDSPNCQ